MHYDPIKRSLGKVFNKTPLLRKLFYKLLDLLLLRAWHVHRELKEWKKNVTNGKVKILDAGAGFGQYSFYLSGWGNNYLIDAVDVKQEQVDDCNRFFQQIGRQQRAKFQFADLTKLNINNVYDLAISVDVMEHILEDVEVFKNIHAALKPGGMLLISTPSDQGGSGVDDEGQSSFIEEHVRDGYNIDDIQRKLKLAGFSTTTARYAYGVPGKIAWLISMKYPIMLLGLSKLFFVLLPFYYLLLYPFAFVLNYLDSVTHHKSGTGLIVKAYK
jgi:SAM-dependent methyltransferase